MRPILMLLGAAALAGVLVAEAPPTDSGPVLRFTATTANVTGAPDAIRIDLFRWSTDAERAKLMDAWDLKPGAVSAGRGAGGRGGARGARGPAPARGGRGRAERGAAPPPKPTPEGELTLALQEAQTIGYLWSSEAAGYAVRYAGKFAQPDGGERIILITDRRLGEANALWRAPNQAPAAATSATGSAPYDFSIIELRVNAKGAGEGKLSLREKLVPDAAAGIVALPDYDSLPVVFTKVKQEKP